MQFIRAIDGALGVIQLYSSHLIASLPETQCSAAKYICWAECSFSDRVYSSLCQEPGAAWYSSLGPARAPLLHLFPEWKGPSPW